MENGVYAIFGTQGYALGVYEAIKTLYPDKTVECFLVSEFGGINPDILCGLPVRTVSELSNSLTKERKSGYEVLIATPDNVQPEIETLLDSYGFVDHTSITSKKWDRLMLDYHSRLGCFKPLASLPIGQNHPLAEVYMAKHEGDRPLRDDHILSGYITPIQVGSALSNTRVADIVDSEGENISGKNGNYSELTALYWMWKNRLKERTSSAGYKDSESNYYGLVQYRRIFSFSDEDLLRLIDNDVDAVLPYPLIYEPDINAHHERYLKTSDWEALLSALHELQPDYAEAFPKILSQRFLYNYNVILAKKPVLRDYCEWLFPILKRTEDLSVPKGSERADRYIGYMAESLETLYFMHNADRLNIAHTGCRMLT